MKEEKREMEAMDGQTCMHRSELLMPPSTASSLRAWLLSFSMASRIALVWKHVASNVALAMCPLSVWAVIPTTIRS